MFWSLDPFGTVKGVIESWQPKGCTTEKDFEQSLLKELQKKLKKQRIQTQYGLGRQRIDIVVDGKVPIELKKDLKRTSALQRAVGQLEQYLQDWDHLFLVLCGDIEPDLLKTLEKYAGGKEDDLEALLSSLPFGTEKIIIMVKR
ncbi:MAG: hypothetical protein AABX40_08045 [Candidatus Hydrothermarchaeota archaeon]